MLLTLSKNLAPLKVDARRKVDLEAEKVRQFFITPGSGQAMVYREKQIEAEAVVANPSISVSEVPHIAAEAELNQITLLDQAAVILTMAHQWIQISVLIEERRLVAKATVDQATNPIEIEAAAEVDWSDILAMAPPA